MGLMKKNPPFMKNSLSRIKTTSLRLLKRQFTNWNLVVTNNGGSSGNGESQSPSSSTTSAIWNPCEGRRRNRQVVIVVFQVFDHFLFWAWTLSFGLELILSLAIMSRNDEWAWTDD
ncbi:hypothetical protein FRX31_032092 [Thalictrum thalictroides]|uniref:Transmembrane protein n=1 Tax=Thalictrum thalictroides TaxID=46969 RepID=A0A7J6V0P6_THATH|nr:hypothetical protein FRX31_032092 [Thalictrum thalictroides]